MFVDSGMPGHVFDNAITARLKATFDDYKVLDVPREIVATGGECLTNVAKRLLSGTTVAARETRCLVQFTWSIMPGLGRNMFLLIQAARHGVE